jgi:hypothetical protein
MTDTHDRRSQNRVRSQLEAARSAGAWMPWAGASLAVLLWGGAALWLVATMGVPAILGLSPMLLAGGAATFLAPGLVLICAGIMARESRRSTEANAIVLTSARLLLEPADSARGEVATIAEAIAKETQLVNKALADTRGRLDTLKTDIEQSVSAALKASEIVRADSEVLVSKMGAERQSLAQLSESIRNQADALAKAIPRHAQLMSEAARSAQEEVRKSDEALDHRLRSLDETAGRLAQRVDQLDTMGAESRKRSQNLASALMRLDEQLVQSTRMVEAAMRAGELATAASRSTADSLRDATSDALEAALRASETIATRSAAASQEARESMSLLKDAALQAEATTRAASLAAKSQADETEERINRLSDVLYRAATKATNVAESGLDRARQRIEKASLLIGQMKDEPAGSSIDDLAFRNDDDLVLDRKDEIDPLTELELSRPASTKPTASADFDAPSHTPDPMLDHIASLRRPQTAPPLQPEPAQPSGKIPAYPPQPIVQRAIEPLLPEPRAIETRPLEPRALEPRAAEPRAADPRSGDPRTPGLSWRDLLTGIEEAGPQVREQTAATMIAKLDRAGIRLGVVKATDLRRIASASHQGERQRRRAIRDVAPGEIQRVSRLLDADRDLQQAAKSFVAVEEPDALAVLAGAERAREDAHPRLSAYLLLDAALGATI